MKRKPRAQPVSDYERGYRDALKALRSKLHDNSKDGTGAARICRGWVQECTRLLVELGYRERDPRFRLK